MAPGMFIGYGPFVSAERCKATRPDPDRLSQVGAEWQRTVSKACSPIRLAEGKAPDLRQIPGICCVTRCQFDTNSLQIVDESETVRIAPRGLPKVGQQISRIAEMLKC